ncbi:MAG: hypothetical protein K0S65_1488, partial [Labilithrix sp.]|nr:hypothetical protein [Labilithrix sp.]
DADGKWHFIDDNTQNQTGVAAFASDIWAPSENELYYAVARGTIVHGARAAPGQSWTWTSSVLPDLSSDHGHPATHETPVEAVTGLSHPTLGVWGTGPDDVYAWFTNTVFHLKSESGGATAWVPEYTADDVPPDAGEPTDNELFAVDVTGSSRDDVWFAYVRTNLAFIQGACPVVVHKTPAGVRRISDGVPRGSRCSYELPGMAQVGNARGWLTELEPLGPGKIAGIIGGRELVKIAAENGDYAVSTSVILGIRPIDDDDNNWDGTPFFFRSHYHAPDGRHWLAGEGLPATAIVLGAREVWAAGASKDAYQISSVSLSGAPLDGKPYRIRGTSNTNLWLVGPRYALHKTTP